MFFTLKTIMANLSMFFRPLKPRGPEMDEEEEAVPRNVTSKMLLFTEIQQVNPQTDLFHVNVTCIQLK